MTGRYWIIIAIVIVVILIAGFFVAQNQSKKGVVVTLPHPTPTVAAIPTTAGESATVTPLETQIPTAGPTIHHIIITATPELTKTVTPTHEETPTP
jgi:hypothetical protein